MMDDIWNSMERITTPKGICEVADLSDNFTKGRESSKSQGPGVVVVDGADTDPSDEEVLTPEDVASYLHVSRSMAYKILKREDIPSFKVGSLVRVLRKDLLDALHTESNGV